MPFVVELAIAYYRRYRRIIRESYGEGKRTKRVNQVANGYGLSWDRSQGALRRHVHDR